MKLIQGKFANWYENRMKKAGQYDESFGPTEGPYGKK